MFILRTFFLIILLGQSSALFAKPEILWVKWNLEPEYIEAGPYQKTGYLDLFLNFVQQQLPEYKHQE